MSDVLLSAGSLSQGVTFDEEAMLGERDAFFADATSAVAGPKTDSSCA